MDGPARKPDEGLSLPASDDSATFVPVLQSSESAIMPASQALDGSSVTTRRRVNIVDSNPPTVVSRRSPRIDPGLMRTMESPFELGKSLIGQKLGHFQLTEFVGGGGMGAVFRATDEMLGRTVAVKVLSSDRTDDDTLRRFQNEAQSAARLDHPNIARVHYVGEDRGYHYIVFEFIEGVNVRDLVAERGPLPIADVLRYALQVSESLQHAVERDVVHRDIKPANLLVMPDGHVKLVDMGLARLHQVDAPGADLTASGVTLGTFDYISPEQARDPRSADVRSDLYSLGCTIYYMLTGRPPFPNGTVLQKLLSHSSDRPADVRTLRADIPDELVGILNRLLAKQPSDRFQQPKELSAALYLLANQLGFSELSERPHHWTATRRKTIHVETLFPWLVPILLLLTVAFAVHQWSPESPALPVYANAPGVVRNSENHLPKNRNEATKRKSETTRSKVDSPDGDGTPNGQSPPPSGKLESSAGKSGKANPSLATNPSGGSRVVPKDDRSPVIDLLNSMDAYVKSTVADVQRGIGGTSSGTAEITASDLPREAESHAVTSEGTPSQDAIGISSQLDPLGDSPVNRSDEPLSGLEIRSLIVGADLNNRAQDSKVVATVEEAIRYANTNSNVERIVLAFSGSVDVEPIKIESSRLTISPALRCRPVLTFRSSSRSKKYPIQIGAGNLMLADVQLRWILPESLDEPDAFLQLDRTQHLHLQNATVTIEGAERAPSMAAFMQIQPLRTSDRMMAEDSVNGPTPPFIELSCCIVRGAGSLLRIPEGLPSRFRWEQGLFVSSERLIEIGGSQLMPRATSGVKLELNNVTAIVGRGLLLSMVDQTLRYPLEFNAEISNSIISCPASTDSLATAPPLVELRAVPGVDSMKKRPFFGSSNSFYPNLKVLLRVDPSGNPNSFTEYTFYEREKVRELRWEDSRNSVGTIKWKGLPSNSMPLWRHTKLDYRLEESSREETKAGFDPARLPDLDAITMPPPASINSGNTATGDD